MLVVIASLLGFVRITHAQTIRGGTTASAGSKEVIDGSAYFAGNTVDVAGEINGDLYCTGQSVTVSGVVHGDVLCAGQSVHISGTVDGNVRVAGQEVQIAAKVGKNVTSASQNFTLSAASEVGGDVTGGATNATLNGSVGRDVLIGANNLEIYGSIGRNVRSSVTNSKLGSTAKIGGTLSYTSKNDMVAQSGSSVAGSVLRTEPSTKGRQTSKAISGGFKVYWFLAMLFSALGLVLLFPSVYVNTVKYAVKQPWKTALVGRISMLVVPVVLIVFMITVLGIPLALLLGLVWLIILGISGSFSAYYIGTMLLKDQKNSVLRMLAGVVVLSLASIIPIIGGITTFASLILGTGMLLREIMHRTPTPKY